MVENKMKSSHSLTWEKGRISLCF